MIGLIVETFRPWVLIGVCIIQAFLIFAGCLAAFTALVVHSGLGLAESLAFFVPAVLLTAVRRRICRPPVPGSPRPTALLVGVVIVIAYAGTGLLLRAAGFRFNLTDSVPVGIYRETADDSAPYAAFCLPLAPLRAAQSTGLTLPAGDCPGGVAPLLKPLFRASLAHPVTLTERGFLIDGKLLPNTAPKNAVVDLRTPDAYPLRKVHNRAVGHQRLQPGQLRFALLRTALAERYPLPCNAGLDAVRLPCPPITTAAFFLNRCGLSGV